MKAKLLAVFMLSYLSHAFGMDDPPISGGSIVVPVTAGIQLSTPTRPELPHDANASVGYRAAADADAEEIDSDPEGDDFLSQDTLIRGLIHAAGDDATYATVERYVPNIISNDDSAAIAVIFEYFFHELSNNAAHVGSQDADFRFALLTFRGIFIDAFDSRATQILDYLQETVSYAFRLGRSLYDVAQILQNWDGDFGQRYSARVIWRTYLSRLVDFESEFEEAFVSDTGSISPEMLHSLEFMILYGDEGLRVRIYEQLIRLGYYPEFVALTAFQQHRMLNFDAQHFMQFAIENNDLSLAETLVTIHGLEELETAPGELLHAIWHHRRAQIKSWLYAAIDWGLNINTPLLPSGLTLIQRAAGDEALVQMLKSVGAKEPPLIDDPDNPFK